LKQLKQRLSHGDPGHADGMTDPTPTPDPERPVEPEEPATPVPDPDRPILPEEPGTEIIPDPDRPVPPIDPDGP
jgi:hypothetical protein